MNNLAYLFFIVIFCGLVSGTRFLGLDSGIDAGLVWECPASPSCSKKDESEKTK